MKRLWLLALCALWSACTVRVFSPPSGQPPLESAAPLGKGKMAARGDVALGASAEGPGVTTYRASVARGINDQLDLSLSPSILWIQDSGPHDSHPGIYALRLGVKYARSRHVALSAGLGAGGSAGGGFVSPDLGFIVGYENPYFVPFGSLRGFFSVPFAKHTVEIWSGSADDPPEERIHRLRADFSLGLQWSVGIKLPLVHDARARVRPALLCAITPTWIREAGNDRDRDVYAFLDCGLEAAF